MQPGGRRGDCALACSEHGLVIGRVLRRRTRGPVDVGRQGQRSSTAQRLGEGVVRLVKTHDDPAVGIAGQQRGFKVRRTFEGQRVAGPQPPGVAGQSVPGAVGPGLVEREPDPCLPAPRRELGRDDASVVRD